MINYTALRKFAPYPIWSSDLIGLWNRAVRIYRVTVARGRLLTDAERESLLDEVENTRNYATALIERIRRARWEIQPVDIDAIRTAVTPVRVEGIVYVIEEGITFETLYANILAVLEAAEKRLAKYVVIKYVICCTYKNEVSRNIEFHFDSFVRDTPRDREMAIKKARELLIDYIDSPATDRYGDVYISGFFRCEEGKRCDGSEGVMFSLKPENKYIVEEKIALFRIYDYDHATFRDDYTEKRKMPDKWWLE